MEESPVGSRSLSRDERKRLMTKRDGPGLVTFTLQMTALVLFSLLTLRLAADGNPLRFASVLLAGLAMLTFFASMHESGHGTAFATPWLNRAALWISAPIMLQSPTFFREFHFEHHRSTSDPHKDPEVSGLPNVLGEWPGNPFFYLGEASGQHLLAGKAAFTLACALVPFDAMFDRFFPFLRRSLRRRVAWESRLVVVLYILGLWVGWTRVAGFPTLLLAWPIAHLGLGLFVLPEHTGLPRTGTQIHRTRTTITYALLRRTMWNMSYHAEHHACPSVPFHGAPELHRILGPELEHVSAGYLAFHAEALRRSIGRR
jgi:fatty acid desaturase